VREFVLLVEQVLDARDDGHRARRLPAEDVIAEGFDRDFVVRVSEMIRRSEFKRQMPPIAKVGGRSSGSDYLYPRRRPKLD
jgi:NH3-dependent NAD+ synthetase